MAAVRCLSKLSRRAPPAGSQDVAQIICCGAMRGRGSTIPAYTQIFCNCQLSPQPARITIEAVTGDNAPSPYCAVMLCLALRVRTRLCFPTTMLGLSLQPVACQYTIARQRQSSECCFASTSTNTA